jgi:hypothetical protein
MKELFTKENIEKYMDKNAQFSGLLVILLLFTYGIFLFIKERISSNTH